MEIYSEKNLNTWDEFQAMQTLEEEINWQLVQQLISFFSGEVFVH